MWISSRRDQRTQRSAHRAIERPTPRPAGWSLRHQAIAGAAAQAARLQLPRGDCPAAPTHPAGAPHPRRTRRRHRTLDPGRARRPERQPGPPRARRPGRDHPRTPRSRPHAARHPPGSRRERRSAVRHRCPGWSGPGTGTAGRRRASRTRTTPGRRAGGYPSGSRGVAARRGGRRETLAGSVTTDARTFLVAAIDHATGAVLGQRQVADKRGENTTVSTLAAGWTPPGGSYPRCPAHEQEDRPADHRAPSRPLHPLRERESAADPARHAGAAHGHRSGVRRPHPPGHRPRSRSHRSRTLRVADCDDTLFPGARQVFRLRRDTGGLDGVRTSKDIVYGITSLPADLV